MMKKLTLAILCLISACNFLSAQDTLPKFSVKNVGGNRIIVSWANYFEIVKQISIQRSFDSVLNYKTIMTVPDPDISQNGYMDTKAPNDRMFYRLYILLDKGVFLFSEAKRPVMDTASRKLDISGRLEKFIIKDSINVPERGINNKIMPDVFIPSIHVYTYKDGYLRVNLPDDENKKYHLKFFEDNGTFLFELKDVKVRTFKIDKSSFYHAGWFRFELFESDKLIEKHKFYLEKDF